MRVGYVPLEKVSTGIFCHGARCCYDGALGQIGWFRPVRQRHREMLWKP